MANKCSYARRYYDYDLEREEPYKCPAEEHSKGLCKFHLKEYAVDENNRGELIGLLNQELKKANTSGSALKWIGYQIPPAFDISSEFKVNVYLDWAYFLGDASFDSSNFESNASFMELTSMEKQSSMKLSSKNEQTSLLLSSTEKQPSLVLTSTEKQTSLVVLSSMEK